MRDPCLERPYIPGSEGLYNITEPMSPETACLEMANRVVVIERFYWALCYHRATRKNVWLNRHPKGDKDVLNRDIGIASFAINKYLLSSS